MPLGSRPLLWGLELAAALCIAGLASGLGKVPGDSVEISVLVLLLVPAHIERFLALGGKIPAPRLGVAAVEAGALAISFFERPELYWSLELATIVSLIHVCRADPEPDRKAGPGMRLFLLGLTAITAFSLLQNFDRRFPHAPFRTACFLVILFAALDTRHLGLPGDPRKRLWDRIARSTASTLRSSASFFAILAICLSTAADPIFVLLRRYFVSLDWIVVGGDLTCGFIAVVALINVLSERSNGADVERTRRAHARRILIPVAVGIVAMMIGDMALWIMPSRYQKLVTHMRGEWHVPGGTYLYQGAIMQPRQPHTNLVRWNKLGYHDHDHDKAKPKGSLRVVVLGDSFIEGLQVPTAQLYTVQLEGLLTEKAGRPVEVVALSSDEWAQRNELEALRSQGLAYDPDLVLTEFLPEDDVVDCHDRLASAAYVRSQNLMRLSFIRATRSGFFFQALLFDKMETVARYLADEDSPLDLDVYREKPKSDPDLWVEAWQHTEGYIKQMRDALDANGRAMVVVGFPSSSMEIEASTSNPPAMPHGVDLRFPARRIGKICAGLGVEFLDLAPELAALPEAERQELHLADDGHWTAAGHREAARATSRFLIGASRAWRKALARTPGAKE